MHGLTIVQQREDKHPTLAYVHQDRWYSYSNNKYLKWTPTDWLYVDTLAWALGKPGDGFKPKLFVVQTDEGDYVMAHWLKDDWFSQHSGRRLMANIIRWASVR